MSAQGAQARPCHPTKGLLYGDDRLLYMLYVCSHESALKISQFNRRVTHSKNMAKAPARPVPTSQPGALLYSSKWLVKCCVHQVSTVSLNPFDIWLTHAIDVNARPPGPSQPPNQGLLNGDDKLLNMLDVCIRLVSLSTNDDGSIDSLK